MAMIMTEAMMWKMVTRTIANRCIIVVSIMIISIYHIDVNNIFTLLCIILFIQMHCISLGYSQYNNIVQVNTIAHHP